MADTSATPAEVTITEPQIIQVEADIQVRDVARRELEVRLVPWNKTIETVQGLEEFRRGALAGTPDDGIILHGLEHEATFGIGQAGEPRLTRQAAGRSIKVWEADDGGRAILKVGRTQKGDELLALAEDRIVRGVSVEFSEVPGGTSIETRGGRRVRVHNRVALSGVSMVNRPAYGEQATILAVRTEEPKVADDQTVTEPAQVAPPLDLEPVTRSIEASFGALADRIGRLETESRASFELPAAKPANPDLSMGRWVKMALGALSGDRIPDAETRAWSDITTTDNLGVVPEAFSPTIVGIIDASRPFLNSTTRIPTPASGMTLNVPVLGTRPATGVQVNEKDVIESNTPTITSTGFDAITIAGGGDISLQLLRRSDPSYLDLYLRLLAESISKTAEAEAIAALLASGVTPGTGTLNPEALLIGEAWVNAKAVGQTATNIWLSSDAWALFIDAKADGTNIPLYGSIASSINVGSNGPFGTISGLTPVYTPALDGTGTDVVVGPRTGFAWAEDGAFTLQVDVPSKAGRDVALVSIDWFAPLYPDAFTTWAV